MRDRILGPAKRAEISMKQTVTSARSLNQMLALQKKHGGLGIRGPGGKITRTTVTQDLARQRLVKTLKMTGLNQAQIALQLSRLAPILAKFPATAGKPGVKVTPPPRPAKDALVSSGGFMPVSAGDVVLDRASLAQAVVSQMRGGLAGRAGAGALGGGDPGRVSPPTSSAGGEITINVPLMVDGREIARAIGKVRLDEMERSGESIQPGDRTLLLERGFLGAK
jgi:hypothetical protein